MNKFLRRTGLALLILVGIIGVIVLSFYGWYGIRSSFAIRSLGPEAPVLVEGDLEYRDLNKNGRLDPYENRYLPVEERVSDLLDQMTLEEKAGMMFMTIIAMGEGGTLQERPSISNPFTLFLPTSTEMLIRRHMNHFNVLQMDDAQTLAEWHNLLQKIAERTRLGIPVTLASDPRHAFNQNPGANLLSGPFSQWPEPIGLAATRDTALVQQFGDIARQEYLSVGLRLALHPMADLATEPRWSRVNGTFGEDADLSARMIRSYILGFQGDSLGIESVATMTKHFPGAGPQEEGLDSHFDYGKNQAYPGDQFDYHVRPFVEGALSVRTAQIMASYGVSVGQTSEEVAAAFNHDIVTGLLREELGFEGVVCTDWSVLSNKKLLGLFTILPGPAWGVEDLSPILRTKKALEAGIDQFGGEANPEWVVELVERGEVQEDRIDSSVRRILHDKFTLGLFDDPYVDAEVATDIAGAEDFQIAGLEAQRRSLVLLKNVDSMLPLTGHPRLYVENIDSTVAMRYGDIVTNVKEAEIAILRLQTPWQPREDGGMLASFFHQGDLDFKGEERARILEIARTVPTIVDIYLERPAVMPDIAAESRGLIANFGATDAVIMEAIFGHFSPSGTLPFELPSSMKAVRQQHEDVPYDSSDPLFSFGHGLQYPEE